MSGDAEDAEKPFDYSSQNEMAVSFAAGENAHDACCRKAVSDGLLMRSSFAGDPKA